MGWSAAGVWAGDRLGGDGVRAGGVLANRQSGLGDPNGLTGQHGRLGCSRHGRRAGCLRSTQHAWLPPTTPDCRHTRLGLPAVVGGLARGAGSAEGNWCRSEDRHIISCCKPLHQQWTSIQFKFAGTEHASGLGEHSGSPHLMHPVAIFLRSAEATKYMLLLCICRPNLLQNSGQYAQQDR